MRLLIPALLALGLATSVAAAAPPQAPAPSPPPLAAALTGEAKDDYVAGRILLEDGDFTGAAVKFQHAFDLAHDPRLLWNIAVCEKDLRHYAKVLRLLERYESEGGALLTEDQRAASREVARTIRLFVSTLRVEVSEPGATVYVDGEAAGTTPLPEPLHVDLGTRQIRVSKPGFQDQTVTATVSGGSQSSVSVSLTPEPPVLHDGRLVVSADAGDAIAVDGAAVGTGYWGGRLPSGAHTVRITAPDRIPHVVDLVLRDGETRALDVTLQQERHGISPVLWIAGGAVLAAGLATGGYFLFNKPAPTVLQPTIGTMQPGTIQLQWR